jgi:hypothetical protein
VKCAGKILRNALLAAIGMGAVIHSARAQLSNGTAQGAYNWSAGSSEDNRTWLEDALGITPLISNPLSGLKVSGYIGVQESFTDNVTQSATKRQADIISQITPGLQFSESTRLLQGNLVFSPVGELYVKSGNLNSISNNLNGSGLLTIVPDWLFVSGRAFSDTQTYNGTTINNRYGLGSNAGNSPASSQSYDISPYIKHAFGDLLTLNAGYDISYSSYSGLGVGGPTAQTAPVTPVSMLSTNLNTLISQHEFTDITTGSRFGRWNEDVRVDGEQESGGGISNGSHTYSAVSNTSYALNRFLTGTISTGYEDIFYNGQPVTNTNSGQRVTNINPAQSATHIDDMIWGFGLKYLLGDKGSLSLSYGHRDGFNSPSFAATYKLTHRTTVYGNYTEGLSTSAELFQTQVQNSRVDQSGRTVSLQDNAPLILSNSLLSNNQNLSRVKVANFGMSTFYSRDILTLGVNYQSQIAVATINPKNKFSTQTMGLNMGWDHDINPVLSLHTGLSLNRVRFFSGSQGNSDYVSLSTQLSYRFTDTITGTVGYVGSIFDNTNMNVGGQRLISNAFQNTFTVGLRKTFR